MTVITRDGFGAMILIGERPEHADMNKRRYYRLDRHFMVSYRCLNSADPYQMSQTRDISENGLAILSARPFSIGDRLQMMVAFPFRLGERVTLNGKIVSCTTADTGKTEYRIGVQFLGLDSKLNGELAAYIAMFQKKEQN